MKQIRFFNKNKACHADETLVYYSCFEKDGPLS